MNKKVLTIIPAAGRGSRMLSLTENCAKSMIPVANKPLIAHLLDQLIENKMEDVFIVVGYQKDSIINYVDTFYKRKLNITYIEQTELLGLGYAIYLANKQIDVLKYDSVFIMLGDAIFNTNEIFKFNYSYVACKYVNDFSRWCIAVKDSNNYLEELLDKPKDEPKDKLALIGAYYFDDIDLYLRSVNKAIDSGIKIRNEFQISTAIENYLKEKRIKTLILGEDDWFDFGELSEYNRNKKKFNQSRFFNNICYGDNDTVFKSSSNYHKIQKEIMWYLALPKHLRKYCPSLVEYNLNDALASYATEYCVGNSLQEMWLYNNLSFEDWSRILYKIFEMITNFKSNSIKSQITVQKIIPRFNLKIFLEKQLKERVSLNELFENDIIINGINYDVNNLLSNLKEFDISDNECQICHGDLVFSNIIYNSSLDSIKVIDPRGDFCGNILYGDIRYDIAKLAQCIIGDYDYIVNDLFILDDNGYKIYKEDNDKQQKLFDLLIKESGCDRKEILFITAIQFITMIPLHAENKDHQTMMKYKAIELLSEVFNEE